ncbi:MAG: glycosyltransferase family 2 protein [Nonlabens sp.]|uniref:glycosyltransferase family 2 protein n=1 Tax=Nonlabens sp. TaxID=1888209 RepID=UPI003EF558BB
MIRYSIVIRVKNEFSALELLLKVLVKQYINDIKEIIIVDNNSTDGSRELAADYGCVIVPIHKFTYGKAINNGIQVSQSDHIILLSAHSIPIGDSFFKSLSKQISNNEKIGAARFINSATNYKRALSNDFKIKNPLTQGLTASCAYVYKGAWNEIKFDEQIIACEDKLWSNEIMNAGYQIVEITETFFYSIKRSEKAILNRMRNEEIASHQMLQTKPISITRAFLIFVKNSTVGLLRVIIHHIKFHYMKFKNQRFINKYLK